MSKDVEILDEEQVIEEAPVMYIELVDKRGSGFIQDGTENTPYRTELNSPSVRFIPNEGYRYATKTEMRRGKEVEVRYKEKIRYIKNESIISVSEQKRLGIEPNPFSREDKIVIEKGDAMIVGGSTADGLFEYIRDVFYNESVIGRPDKVTALFRTVEMDKRHEADIDHEMEEAEAMRYVGKLYEKRGKGDYFYEEEKINGLCQLLNIMGESPAARLRAIIVHAKNEPGKFLKLVLNWEGVTDQEVTLALTLNVIKFDDNVAMYVEKNKIITELSVGKKAKQDEKIAKLANFLRTAEGHTAYVDLKAEIKTKQNEKL